MKKDKRVEIGKSIQALIKSTGQNEATAADGGNLVFRDMKVNEQIWVICIY